MEPTLVIIGVNCRSAPVEVRERFWINESRRYEALVRLARAEAIEEVAVLATPQRTEFVLWTRDASAAANSVLNFLTHEYGLKLGEWQHFYRHVGEPALVHLFKVASSLDSIIVGEPEIAEQMRDAWLLSQKVGTNGRSLDAIFQKALAVSDRVRKETSIGDAAVSVPYAAVELARQVFGTLEGRTVVLLGTKNIGEVAVQLLRKYGATDIRVVNRAADVTQEVADRLGATTSAYEERWKHFIEADIIVSSTACPHVVFTREEGDYVKQERHGRPLLMIDMAIPRDIDPKVRSVHGIFLYDIDDLEQVVKRCSGDHAAAAENATQIVLTEAKFFSRKMAADQSVPTVIALRERLEEICRQELEAFRHDAGPFTQEQDDALAGLTKRISSRIAGSLVKELKGLPQGVDQARLTSALERLFHLSAPQGAVGPN